MCFVQIYFKFELPFLNLTSKNNRGTMTTYLKTMITVSLENKTRPEALVPTKFFETAFFL